MQASPRVAGAAAALLLSLALPAAVTPQDARPAQASQPAQPDAVPAAAAPSDGYTYNAVGRRDPFVSLIGRGETKTPPPGPRTGGVEGLLTSELTVRGVLKSRDGYIAIVQGPDQKAHRVRTGDRLADGTVQAVTPDGLVIVQEVNDPLSLVRQREIRKALHGSDEGK